MLKKWLIHILYALLVTFSPISLISGSLSACHIRGTDMTNFRNSRVSSLAPVPPDENGEFAIIASCAVRTSPKQVKIEEIDLGDSISESILIDLSVMDGKNGNNVMVPSACHGSK